MIDLTTIDPEGEVDKVLKSKNFLKRSSGEYIIYNRKWLLKNLEMEFDILKRVRDGKEIKPFSREDFENWMKARERLEDDGK